LYSFEGLPTGNYRVEEVPGADWHQSLPRVPTSWYSVTLLSEDGYGAPSGAFGNEHVIAGVPEATSVHTADLDGDGDQDVLATSYSGDKIAWYANLNGEGSFGPEQVVTTLADGANCVFAADLDGDGDRDVVSASYYGNSIAWYENVDGAGTFGPQQPITTTATGAYSVFATDLDHDGDQDVLAACFYGDNVVWYENTTGSGTAWTSHGISAAALAARSVYAADLDGDGDQDVLSASSGDGKIAWYENTDPSGNFGSQRVIAIAPEAMSVSAADLDGDGDQDVLAASFRNHEILWYENVDSFGTFVPRPAIDAGAHGASAVYASDLDLDGDQDVLAASFGDNRISWYENTDSLGSFGAAQPIATGAGGALSVFAADLDGDEDLDVLSAAFVDGKIAWYENSHASGRRFDFGNYTLPSVGGMVWHDLNVDGIQDANEPGRHEAEAELVWVGPDGLVDGGDDVSWGCTSTDLDGDYRFDHVSPGQYYLEFEPPPGYFFHGLLDQGSDDARDHDVHPWTHRTEVFEVRIGTDDFSRDAAVTGQRASFSGETFQDLDGDGIQDETDPRILGAEVELSWAGADGAPGGGDDLWVDTQITDVGGNFNFTGLWPGVYYLHVPVPRGVDFSPPNQGPDEALDSDFDPLTGRTAVFALGPGANDVAQDAGFIYPYTSIHGRQFHDVDGNGAYDAGEPFVEGGTIRLLHDDGQLLTTTTTAALGKYSFEYLWPGRYGIEQELPSSDWVQSMPSPLPGYQVMLSATPGVVGTFGSEQLISSAAGGARSVFAEDLDGDGDLDVLSASARDNKIAWYENLDARGALSAERVIATDAIGAEAVYAADLDGDGDADVLSASREDHKIAWYKNTDSRGTFEAQPPIAVDAYGARAIDVADLDHDGDTDVLAACEYDNTIAWYENVSGKGTLWQRHVVTSEPLAPRSVRAVDLNGSGSVVVLVASAEDHTIAYYENTGTDWVKHVITSEAEWATCVDAADLDGDGDTDVLSASAGDDKIAWYENRGVGWATHVISLDAEWATSVCAKDLNGDGDVDVLSASAWDDEIACYENIDGQGTFVFDSWSHLISASADDARAVYAADLNGDGYPDVLSASAGDDKIAWYENADGPLEWGRDFGSYPLPSIGNLVWHDLDGDGMRDPGEPGIEDAEVTLYSAGGDGQIGGGDDALVATTRSDADGQYGFLHLEPGDYYLKFTPPDDAWVFGLQDQGDDEQDSDVHPVSGLTGVFAVAPGPDDLAWDAALTNQPAAVDGWAFHDLNFNGLQDSGEPGVLGVDVDLIYAGADGAVGGDDDVPVETRITDSSGTYHFTGLSPGNYYLQLQAGIIFSPQDQGDDDVTDSDVDQILGRTPVFALTTGQSLTFDAGLFYPSAGILGRQFHDRNVSGDVDRASGEQGLDGWTIRLCRPDGHLLTSTTTGIDFDGDGQIDPETESGWYAFGDLLPGTYRVEQAPTNWVQSLPGEPTPYHTVKLVAGQIETERDFGNYQLKSIGDRVFHDRNGNGIWDDDTEPGLEGVEVSLFQVAPDGSGTLVQTTTTTADGTYRFDGLPVGEYAVEFTRPDGFAFSPPDQGSDDSRDSDPHPYSGLNTGRTDPFPLDHGADDDSRDAGLIGSEPTFGYAVGTGSTGIDEGRAVAIDAVGNVVMVGHFTDAVDFDPGPEVMRLISAGESDVFVAKYAASGALLWVRAMGHQGHDAACGVAVDEDLNVYVTGEFSGTVDFDPGVEIFDLVSSGQTDVFVAKLDRYGDFVWARRGRLAIRLRRRRLHGHRRFRSRAGNRTADQRRPS